jgi:hypothetical protein
MEATSDRVFVDVTPDYILDLGKDQTTVHRQIRVGIYLGKWLKVSGLVRNVTAIPSQSGIVTISLGDNRGIDLYFNMTWIDRVQLLKVGQNISAIGEIDQIRRTEIVLQNCELTEAGRNKYRRVAAK